MADRLLDLLDSRLGEALGAEMTPEAASRERHLPRANKTVYIDHPGPDGNVHQCQETPY
jgi:hypothetical protein